MKAVILAGGRGKRLEGITKEKNKCMLELKGKRLIERSLEAIAASTHIDEIIILVGYRAEDIVNAFGTEYKGKQIRYAFQDEPRGLVHALECCKAAIGKDDFLLLLGDEILVNPRYDEMLSKFENEKLFGICGVAVQPEKSKISRTYSLIGDGNGRIYRLIEKPRKPLNNLQGTGNCTFRNGLLSYIERTPIHYERKEKELPDLIQCAIDDGEIVKSFVVCDNYFNINSEQDLQDVEKLF